MPAALSGDDPPGNSSTEGEPPPAAQMEIPAWPPQERGCG